LSLTQPIQVPRTEDSRDIRKWREDLVARVAFQTNEGDPVNTVLPRHVGDFCYDTTNSHWYISNAISKIAWSNMTAPTGRIDGSTYGAEPGTGDNTTALTNFFQALADGNAEGQLRPGTYLISEAIVINGNSSTGTGRFFGLTGSRTGDSTGVIIKWDGSDSVDNTMLRLNGVDFAHFRNIVFNGNDEVGKCLHTDYSQGDDGYAPDTYLFEHCWFLNTKGGSADVSQDSWSLASATAASFYISGADNCSQYTFIGCVFALSSVGFRSDNPNALVHVFIGCQFSRNYYNTYLNSGSFEMYGCSFGTAIIDNYLTVHSNVVFDGCWSERSSRFIYTDFRYQLSSVSVRNCQISSYPWSFWKRGYTSTPPTDNIKQWCAIYWDRPSATLNVQDTIFVDPFNGQSAGGALPQYSGVVGIFANYNADTPQNVVTTGSVCRVNPYSNTYTKEIVHYLFVADAVSGYGWAPNSRFGYKYHGPKNSSQTIPIYAANVHHYVMTGNWVQIHSLYGGVPGDEITLIFEQDSTGSRDISIWPSNVKFDSTGSSVSGAASTTLILKFIYDGTYWWQTGRSTGVS
jgi:hypothetical protein